MGMYLNIGNDGFRAARNGEYVDKSMLIREVNAALSNSFGFGGTNSALVIKKLK